MSMTVHYVDSACALGHTPRTMVGVWRGGLNPARVEAMVSLGKRSVDAAGGGRLASLAVVIQLPGGIDPQTRALTKELTARMEEYSSCGAQVLVGSGLWMSAVRMLVSATIVAGRTGVPSKVFDTVDDASRWLLTKNADPRDVLVDAYEILQTQLVAQPLPVVAAKS